MAHQLSISTGAVNQLFILGSIPFSTAAYLQLFQAANAGPPLSGTDPGPKSRKRIHWFGWEPREIGWLSCALQSPGTILFNVDSFDALDARLNWVSRTGLVWIPNLLGCVGFLVAALTSPVLPASHGPRVGKVQLPRLRKRWI